MSDAPDDLARTLADEVDGIALIIASTSGSAGAPALTAAEAIVEHLASVVSRRDADLKTRIEDVTDDEATALDRWMDDHMHGHAVSNSPGRWSCDTGCRTQALQRGVNRMLRSRLPADTDTGRGQ